MNVQNILNQFALLANLSCAEAAERLPLCVGAQARILSRLKPGIDPNDYAAELEYAAAAYVFHQYIITDSLQSDALDFSAGDVKISCGREKDAAIRLACDMLREAYGSIGRLLVPDAEEGFAFSGM